MSTKTQMYDAPREVWVAVKPFGQPCAVKLTGEDDLRWYCENSSYAKRLVRVVTEAEFKEYSWVVNNRYWIGTFVSAVQDPAILRQIATLIGYKEGA